MSEASENEANVTPGLTLADVYRSPGHLIRRAQQIAVAIFFDGFQGFDVTPVQYAAMIAIRDRPGMDQRTLVNCIAIDRSTVGTMLRVLERRELISRVIPKENMRVKRLYIESAGEQLLDRTEATLKAVQDRILAPLNLSEQAVFLDHLSRIVNINNNLSRAPLKNSDIA